MEHQLVICIKNKGYETLLEVRKLYEVVPDPKAEKHQHIRVIDESGGGLFVPKRIFYRSRAFKSGGRSNFP